MNNNYYILLKNYTEIIVLFACGLFIKTAFFESSIMTLFGLVVVFINRKSLDISNDLKQFLYIILAYFFVFTILSDNYRLSIKGSYDFISGLLLFPIIFLLFKKLKNDLFSIFLIVIVLLYLLGNFYYSRRYFFGYQINPNNASIDIFVAMMLGLLLTADTYIRRALGFAIYTVGMILLLYANSRGLLLGVFLGHLVIFYLLIKKKWIFYFSGLITLALFVFYLFQINVKGFGLSRREEIWLPLINYTIENNLFFGAGINVTKAIMGELNVITDTAHNLFLEVFVTSGLVGLVIFIGFLLYFLKYLYQLDYQRNIRFYASVFGLTAFFVAYQFDLKLASIGFTGITMMLLAGLISTVKAPQKST